MHPKGRPKHKLDFPYSINWNFMKDVLTELGFPSLFVEWIMQCVTSTSYSLSINGSLHGFFKGKQGDLTSPFLFVLCLEYLSRSLKDLKDNRDFNYHPMCKDLNNSYLAFADDLMLFSRRE